MTNQSPFEPVKHLLTRLGVYTSSPVAVIRGIPTPSDLGASSSSDRKVKRHSAAPQKLRRQR